VNVEHVRSFVLSRVSCLLMRGFLTTNASGAANPNGWRRLSFLKSANNSEPESVPPPALRWNRSAADPELLDDLLVTRVILPLDVVQKLTALADHLEQPAARVIVLLVRLEMLRQTVDPLG